MNPLRWRSYGLSPAALDLVESFYAAGKPRVTYVDVAWTPPPDCWEPASCDRHKDCMYLGCPHGKSRLPPALREIVRAMDAQGRKG